MSEGRLESGCLKKIEFGLHSLATAHLPSASMDLPSPDIL